MNESVLQILRKTAAIPSMPQVVVRFLEIIQDPAFEYNDLAKALSADPGTAGELLRLTNSAMFGLRQKVTSLRQALALLGPKRTRSFVLGRYLVATLGGPRHGLDVSYFWRRSLASSVLASRFAGLKNPSARDDVFIAALLAKTGIPVLSEAFPEEYGPIAMQYAPNGDPISATSELEAVGTTFSDVTSVVLEEWGLPNLICEVTKVAFSEGPQSDSQPLATFVRAGDMIGRLLCETPKETEIARVCGTALQQVGLEIADLVELLSGVESDLEDLAGTLRIDVIPSSAYQLVANALQNQVTATSGV